MSSDFSKKNKGIFSDSLFHNNIHISLMGRVGFNLYHSVGRDCALRIANCALKEITPGPMFLHTSFLVGGLFL